METQKGIGVDANIQLFVHNEISASHGKLEEQIKDVSEQNNDFKVIMERVNGTLGGLKESIDGLNETTKHQQKNYEDMRKDVDKLKDDRDDKISKRNSRTTVIVALLSGGGIVAFIITMMWETFGGFPN